MIPATMKAVVLHAYGGVENLSYEDVPVPSPAASELLVKTIAASVNPIDFKLRSGAAKDRMPLDLPAILGRDLSGEVAALGEGVTGFALGERVLGLVNRTYAEYVICKPEEMARTPENLDSVEAAALPLVLTTGSQIIELAVRPRQGDTVLVTGALGSVGRVAVFVAKQHGARVIAGVRASQRDDAATLGADSIVVLDDEKQIAGLPELDGVADMVDHDVIGRIIPHIRKGGVLGSVLGPPEAAKGRDLEVRAIMAKPDSARLEQLAGDVASGALSIPIAKRFKLSQIREAHQLAEKGAGGKILLIP
jgi:NADPH:quinone reductase-like Zn-dependent oxidoreductase